MTTPAKEYRVLALSGSLRAGSYNTALLRAADKLNPGPLTIQIYPDLGDLPLYSQDLEQDPPTAVRELHRHIVAADGLLLATPEHNASIPAALKNAIDWMSRMPDGAGMAGKPVAVAGASPGALGAVRAQLALRQILGSVGAEVLAKPEVVVFRAHERFDTDGALTDEFTQNLLVDLLAELAERIERSASARARRDAALART
ncbi:NAD(P)H-dependent oxidoreductase [Nocardia cyriacigeorgica]|uniref:NAD(P)H-dependent oxidoreductase n=1 Tax=Nocardia cyriacigeorgica TaxID=135487 RepID=A0A6P1DDY9_9NOCA|nr:NADPH-dependent FMN reductase [Nocardia cyriacigeorgica]NEW47759.1 NAD(P)H-dependent oxidoreductase [Nocardia cyriacigeorgica]NEW51464.1 NAD(P)H-dependent oxidoreductase [Nocardia cyriacigeorgica]